MSELLNDAGELEAERPYFITKAGDKLFIKPVPPLLIAKVQQAAAKKAEELYPGTPPTYQMVDGGGGIELVAHDDKSAESDEDKAALAAYRAQVQKRSAFSNDRFMRFLLMRGVDIDLPSNEQWAIDQAAFDIVIPTDPSERKLHYIQTEMIGVIGDLSGLAVEILAASGVDQEAVNAARASFRGDLRQGSGSTGQPDRTLPVEGSGPAMADVGPVHRAGSSEAMGAYTQPMG